VCFWIAEVVALHVTHGNLEYVTLSARIAEDGVGIFHPQVNLLADVFKASVAHERAGQEVGFAKNLEAVTDAEHQASAFGETLHRFHDGRKACYGARAQVVTVSETARHNDGVAALQIV
jgi:hypothetical protein